MYDGLHKPSPRVYIRVLHYNITVYRYLYTVYALIFFLLAFCRRHRRRRRVTTIDAHFRIDRHRLPVAADSRSCVTAFVVRCAPTVSPAKFRGGKKIGINIRVRKSWHQYAPRIYIPRSTITLHKINNNARN